jgi:predicted alpha/beta superfamily hydrolase
MKRRLRIYRAVFWVLVLAVCSLGQNQTDSVTNGQTVEIPSKNLKQSRSLTISKPEGYENGTNAYPVLYLLDGESNFEYTAPIVHYLADNERIPEMIVVAIHSGDTARRNHDLTTPSQSEVDNRFSPGNGGADAFLSFISDELIPYVEKNYRTRPYRILVGHSLGGLFAIHTLMEKPKLFNAYIAIDPTVSWNNGDEIVRARQFLSNVQELQADVFVSAANAFGRTEPGIKDLVAALDANRARGFRWNFEWMKDENHLTIPLPSIYSGLNWTFEGWYLIDPLQLFDEGGLEAVDKHFREGGRRYGYERTTSPFTISLIVAGLTKTGRLEEASTLLLHDTKAYPPPWNQLDALARAYAERGNVEQAIRYYKLSLHENPQNNWARQKLNDMGADTDASPKNRPK